MFRLFPTLLLLAFVAPHQGVAATLNVFTERSVFTASTSRFVTETFNDFRGDRSFANGQLRVPKVTIRQSGGLGAPFNRVDIDPFIDSFTAIDGSAFLYAGLAPGDQLVLEFDGPVTAFGADFAGIDDSFPRTVLIDHGGADPSVHTITDVVSFFGLTTSRAFSRVAIIGHESADLGIGVDNLSFGRAAVVPLPGSAALYLSMLLTLGFLGWRSRAS